MPRNPRLCYHNPTHRKGLFVHLPSPASPIPVPLRTIASSVNNRYPGIAYLGFACWLAWSKLAWPAVSACVTHWGVATEGVPYAMRTYLGTNIAILAVIVAIALGDRRLGNQPKQLSFVGLGGILATGGCIAMVFSLWLHAPMLIFDGCCVLTGTGMGLLLTRSMLLFGSLVPWRILLFEAAACNLGALTNLAFWSMPLGVVLVGFCGLPILTAVLFGLSNFTGAPSGVQPLPQPSTRPPTRLFCQFDFTVFLIAFIAESVVYFNNYDPSIRHASVHYTDAVLVVITLGLMAYAVAFPQSHRYEKLYYPTVFAIMVLLGLLFATPEGTGASLVASLTAYQFFGLLVWCPLGNIAFQTKASCLKVFAFGYGCQTLGSITGYLVGHQLNALFHAWNVPLLSFYIIFAMMVLALSLAVYPPRSMRELLLSIPYDDAPLSPYAPSREALWDQACSQVADRSDLTTREREVMALLARGRGSSYISASLGVAPATVYSHTRNIYRKLSVHSREELMALVDKECDPTASNSSC